MILGAQILHINEGKGKLALLKTEDNNLLTYPSCSSFSSFVLFSLLLHISIVFPPRYNSRHHHIPIAFLLYHHHHIPVVFLPPPPLPPSISIVSPRPTPPPPPPSPHVFCFQFSFYFLPRGVYVGGHTDQTLAKKAKIRSKRSNPNNIPGRKMVRGVKTIEMW